MKINTRLLAFILATVFGIVLSLPSFFNIPGPKISLGLDLQGGVSMLMGVNVDDVVKTKYQVLLSQIKSETRSKKIPIDSLSINPSATSLSVKFLDPSDYVKLESIFKTTQGLNFSRLDSKTYTLSFDENTIKQSKRDAISQAISTIRNRLDQFGLSEPSVTQQGSDAILVEFPGIKTLEEENRAQALIMRTAHLQLLAVDEARMNNVDSITQAQAKSYGDIILESSDGFGKYILNEVPILDGSHIKDASVVYDENHQPVVSFTLDSEGAKIFGDFSGANIGKRMAIVLDNKVYTAPVIRQRIGGGSGQISGNYGVNEASDLAITLRSGALPVKLSLLEKRSIGPSMSQDTINASLIALISGFALVVAFMIIYYSLAGVIASLALIINLFLILAVMSIFGATLTLPGMAGIVLTVGIAVDANIIINERIRECLRAGDNVYKAISRGYENASRAIFDSNITSLIASFLLYVYGTGAIKGFAITTAIGIIASIITAIIGTQGIYALIANKIARSKNYPLWFGIKSPAKI